MRIWIFMLALLSVSCTGATGQINAADPIERGLSYIAAAIVTHGVLNALLRK